MDGFSLDYEFCRNMYDLVNESAPNIWTTRIVKSLCIVTLATHWYLSFLKGKGNSSELSLGDGLKPREIIKGIMLIIIIIIYDEIMESLDLVLTAFEQEALADKIAVEDYEMNSGSVAVEQNCDWMCSMVYIRDILLKLVNDPLWPFLVLLEGIARLADGIIYGVFLLERFFFLWMLKFLGAIALAFYPFEKLKKWFWSYVGVYAAIFLMIVPYMLLNLFSNLLYHNATTYIQSKYTIGPQPESGIVWYAPDSVPLMFVLILVTLFKYKLFRKSSEFIYKIFN